MNKEEWQSSERGDLMLKFARKNGVDLRILTLAKAKCASLVKHLMRDERSLKALEVAEKFAKGEATKQELDAAAYAAAYAADAAADSAYYAASANSANERRVILRKAADICREIIDFDMLGIGD